MPDTLYDAIERAIAEPLNGHLFERCAVDLLREHYPTLGPIDGGNDAGMDGVGELPNGERFFLVSTVSKDVRRNLEKNIRSHLKAGGIGEWSSSQRLAWSGAVSACCLSEK